VVTPSSDAAAGRLMVLLSTLVPTLSEKSGEELIRTG
jgi:hypothetical protein